jgi:hypothetical protein
LIKVLSHLRIEGFELAKSFEDCECNSPLPVGLHLAIFAGNSFKKQQAAADFYSKDFPAHPRNVANQ